MIYCIFTQSQTGIFCFFNTCTETGLTLDKLATRGQPQRDIFWPLSLDSERNSGWNLSHARLAPHSAAWITMGKIMAHAHNISFLSYHGKCAKISTPAWNKCVILFLYLCICAVSVNPSKYKFDCISKSVSSCLQSPRPAPAPGWSNGDNHHSHSQGVLSPLSRQTSEYVETRSSLILHT